MVILKDLLETLYKEEPLVSDGKHIVDPEPYMNCKVLKVGYHSNHLMRIVIDPNTTISLS